MDRLDREFLLGLREHVYGRSYNDGKGVGYTAPGHWEHPHRWKASAQGVRAAWMELSEDDWPAEPWTLDLGCGRGTLVKEVRALGWPCFGVDLADDRMDGHCVQASALELPFADAWDLVLAYDIIEHVPSDMQELLFAELRRSVRHMMFVTVPTGEPRFELDSSAGPRNHYFSMTPVGWATHLTKGGFRVIGSGRELSKHGPPWSYGDENYPFVVRPR